MGMSRRNGAREKPESDTMRAGRPRWVTDPSGRPGVKGVKGVEAPRAVSSADPRALVEVEEVRPFGEEVPNGSVPAPAKNEQAVASLNGMLAREHACAIRYATHAAVITGPWSEAVAARLREIASDETAHAEKLRARITALGGTPTMHVEAEDLKPAYRLQEILDVNIAEERLAIQDYRRILEGIPPLEVILFETLEGILMEEQEHLEELEQLRPE